MFLGMIYAMDSLKKVGLWLSALIFGPAIIAAASAFSFSRTVGNTEYVKQTFNEVRVYEALGNFIAEQTSKTSGGEEVLFQKTLAKTATEDRLKNIAENSIDEAYAVLEGDKPANQFNVDVSEFKKAFFANLETNLTKQLTALPACNYANLPTSADVLSYSCLPPGTDVDSVVAQVKKEATSGNQLLKSGQLSVNSFDQNEAGDQPKTQKSEQAETLQKAADLYQLSLWILPVSLAFALLSAVGVIVLSKSKLRGSRRLSMLLLGNSAILIVVSFIIRIMARNFPLNKAEGKLTPGPAFEKAGQVVAIDFATMAMQIGIALFIIGVGLVVLFSVLIAKKEPKKVDEGQKPADKPPSDKKP